MASPGQPQLAGCQIVERIRSDAISETYQAKQRDLGRLVLVKVLTPGILPSSPFAAALEREARLLAELSHPNVLALHDFIKQQDTMYLVLEHVDGWSIAGLVEKIGPLPPALAVAIGIQLARGLEHAHERGMVHRNLEPRNVLVSKTGIVKLIDFAVASEDRLPTAPELLEAKEALTTPHYMSPEQILGEPADPRSDVFSVGVLLHEMLSGKRPFDAPDNRSATQKIRHDPPPLLSKEVPGIPGTLERTVRRCLEKMPGDRFGSANELATALEESLFRAGGGAPEDVVARALYDGGLTLNEPASAARPTIASREPASIGPTVRLLFLCLGLIVVGGGVIQWIAARGDVAAVGRRTELLELAPQGAGHLRVVAQPWAVVFVDGQELATTPFATPIPLRPGKHYVRLEHPNAPTERREIELATGETILLDVTMKVTAPRRDAGAPPPPPDAGDGGADAARPSP